MDELAMDSSERDGTDTVRLMAATSIPSSECMVVRWI